MSERDGRETILLRVSCLWPWAGKYVAPLHFLHQKGPGRTEQGHLRGEVTEYVLQQVVLTAQPRAPSPLQGSKHLPSSHMFFKARRSTGHPRFINVQQNSVSLKPSPIICSSGICKLLKSKADFQGLLLHSHRTVTLESC